MSSNPHYKPDTDTIRGCTPGTFIWHHEHRHQQQLSNTWIDQLDRYTHALGIGATPPLIAAGFILNKPLYGAAAAGLTAFPYLFLNWLLELDALLIPLYKIYIQNQDGDTP
jgi:hypothetical protein